MNREALFARIKAHAGFDLVVIGGGATGAGIAWDAASRGLATLLVEAGDFGQGTSGKSTKLIHGGVRYLAQGQLGLVREGLQERRLLLANAPDHVRTLRFMVPLDGWFDRIKYSAGLRCYDWLAHSPTPARYWSNQEFNAQAPNLQQRFAGAVSYLDAQFDDTRLLLAVLSQAVTYGAVVLNYAEVVAFGKHRGRLATVELRDRETGARYEVGSRMFINATGPAVAATARLDDPASAPQITLSRGSHVVVERQFWPSDSALLMPRTPDGRVMFAIPWHAHVLLGTTDVAVDPSTDPARQAHATVGEIDSILEVTARYLANPPQLSDVRACFAGVRPLAGGAAGGAAGAATARVSREYQLTSSRSGLISITGGKWTTFRRMAQACVDFALQQHGISVNGSRTAAEKIPARAALTPESALPGHDSASEFDPLLVAGLSYRRSDALRAIRHEMARHVDDILARRTRALLLNAVAACAAAPQIARLLAAELGHDSAWITQELDAFERAAAGYRIPHPLAAPTLTQPS